MRSILAFVFLVVATVSACANGVGALRFIGAVTLPNDKTVDGTGVGGLSGIDYDPKTGLWYLLSDDRSAVAPARFYVATLTYGSAVFAAVDVKRAVTLRQADGAPFPKDSGDVVDPEAIRVDPETGHLWWTSEGDRNRGLDPVVKIAEASGQSLTTLPTPDMFKVSKDREQGARNNLSFEGLSFSADGRSIFVAMESATYQDGPVASVEAGTVARIARLDRSGKVLAQYAYPIDPIQARPAGKGADNGVSEILALDDTRLLVVEHCGVEGADGIWANYIRVFEIDISEAMDVSGIASLAGADRPVKRRLVLDMAKRPELGRVDNIEGVSFGPRLANGNRSLVFVSDDNFNPKQVTQFLAFEVLR
jgi:hypothetical protein